MSEAFLEVVVLKCPKCGALIAEPNWFLDLEQNITCRSCKVSFQAKKTMLDKAMVKLTLENSKIKRADIV